MAAVQALRGVIETRARYLVGSLGESAVQDVYDLVRDKLERLRARGFIGPAAGFSAYLNKVISGQVIDVRTRYARLTWLDEPVDAEASNAQTRGELLAEEVGVEGPEALKRLVRAEDGDLVRGAFAKLELRCRQVLQARAIEERPEREVAQELGLSVANVAVTLHRCRRRLLVLLLEEIRSASDPHWRSWLESLVDKLQDVQAKVFRLWWERWSTEDIAREIGRDETHARWLLARAKFHVWQLARESGWT
jgi:RNA polymerase sigma factor (sigma-70 family)